MLKANLHFHSAEDPRHRLSYTLEEGIVYAAARGFGALALTCHGAFACKPAHEAYARERGILLIPGIESNIFDESGRLSHVVILNGGRECEAVRTFDDLRTYRRANPRVFVLAPHPFFYGNFSLRDNLEKHIDLFDAIEHSWFYSRLFDRNIPARRAAKRHGKPLVATSDTHFLDGLDDNYLLADAPEASAEALFEAIRAGRYRNVTRPQRAAAMFWKFGRFTLKDNMLRLRG